jgi:threonine/homoserine/homoserine lactone efflux protein
MTTNFILNVISGIPIGFLMSFALGPVFFSLINYSLIRGFWSSFAIATGVILADVLLIVAVFSGVQLFMPSDDDHVKFYVTLVGGLMLIGMGVSNFLKKSIDNGDKTENKVNKVLLLVLNGFFLNILNPANFFAWLMLSANISQSGNFSFQGQLAVYIGCLIGIYATEIAISYFASLLKKHLNTYRMKMINYTTGAIFIACGLYLLYQLCN